MADEEDTGVEVENEDVKQEDVEQEDVKQEDVEQEELSDDEKLMAKLEEAVEVDVEDIGPLRKKLDISIPRALIEERLGEQFEELKREAVVPGFRRGRAPLRLVEKRFGHEVGDELTAQLVSSGYLAAVKKLELNTLGDPLVWAKIPEQVSDESGMNRVVVSEKLVSTEQALEHLHMPKEDDFTFSCEVELRPEFELPALDGIAVEKTARTVTDEDVTAECKRMLAFRGSYTPVEGEPVEADDLVVGDMKVVVDGKTIKSEANAMLAARDQRYEGLQLTGFGDVLIGKKAGEEVKVEVTFPEDFDTPELRGKSGSFELTIHDIKRLVIPKLTPELLAEFGYEDEGEMREAVKASMEQRLQSRVKEAMRVQVTKYLLDNADFQLPESLSQRQTDTVVRRRMVELYQAGAPEAEITKRMDELRVQAAAEATTDLKLFFVLDKIAEEREIEVTEDEINGTIASIAAMQGKRFDRMRDELSKNDGMRALYLRIRDAKVLDALLESAEITEKNESENESAGTVKRGSGRKGN